MPHKYVNWFEVKPPRSDSIENLTKLVVACDTLGATHPAGKQTAYAIATQAKVNYSQARQLLSKPGFVAVKYKEEITGYYWDKATFGNKYPSHYVHHTKGQVLSEYDTTPEESLGEKAQAARQIEHAIEHAIESASGKVLPLIFERPRTAGLTSVEYRVKFNALPAEATAEQLMSAVKDEAIVLSADPEDHNAQAKMLAYLLAQLHKERIPDE